MLSIHFILETIRLSSRKRYIFTTNGSFKPLILHNWITQIDEACIETKSTAIFRLSLDRYHSERNNYDNLKLLLEWFHSPVWERAKTLFFRSNLSDEAYVHQRISSVSRDLGWNVRWEQMNALTWNVYLDDKEYRVIYRPLIEPDKVGVSDTYNIDEYVDLITNMEGGMVPRFGTPKGCHGCHGCRVEVDCSSCGTEEEDGLDISIDTDGRVLVYGAELSVLGNIYNEVLSYNLLRKRMKDEPAYDILKKYSLQKIISHLSTDVQFGERIRAINYPYNVIRELNKLDSQKLRDKLFEIEESTVEV